MFIQVCDVCAQPIVCRAQLAENLIFEKQSHRFSDVLPKLFECVPARHNWRIDTIGRVCAVLV